MRCCTCPQCISACYRHPGWFAAGEAEKAAIYLGIPWEEFKKKLIKDACDNEFLDGPYVYSPRKIDVDGEESERISANRSKLGTCVFLENNRCSIHEVKPLECKLAFGCGDVRGIRDRVERTWEADFPLGVRKRRIENV